MVNQGLNLPFIKNLGFYTFVTDKLIETLTLIKPEYKTVTFIIAPYNPKILDLGFTNYLHENSNTSSKIDVLEWGVSSDILVMCFDPKNKLLKDKLNNMPIYTLTSLMYNLVLIFTNSTNLTSLTNYSKKIYTPLVLKYRSIVSGPFKDTPTVAFLKQYLYI